MKLLTLSLAAALILLPLASIAREVQTSEGPVTIPDEPKRIIVLNPAMAGNVYALGLPVLAVTESTRSPTAEGYSGVWAAQASEQGSQVLPWDFDRFNMELLLSLEPDLIIGGGQGRPGFMTIEAYKDLSAIAPTILVDASLANWQAELDFLANALGRETEQQAALSTYAARIAQVKAAIDLPPQPTAFLLPVELDNMYFIPEGTATPQLFADVGFEADPILANHPDWKAFGTGDSAEISAEFATEALTAPTIILTPWSAGGISVTDLAAHPIYGTLPAVKNGNAYDFPDYTYRFDYLGALAVLDVIEATFGR
ncbi:MAG: ferric enterobactin (enterochelin)-binding protein [Hyphomicrobiales bacterium]|nr:MAG: ferric enterobactin (enterochelin)-binding protein [Hyphomicrobiales bacterium]